MKFRIYQRNDEYFVKILVPVLFWHQWEWLRDTKDGSLWPFSSIEDAEKGALVEINDVDPMKFVSESNSA